MKKSQKKTSAKQNTIENNIASSKSNLLTETHKSKNILDDADFSKDDPKKSSIEIFG